MNKLIQVSILRFKQLYLNPSYFRKIFVPDIHMSLNRKQNNCDQRLRNIINFTFKFGYIFPCAIYFSMHISLGGSEGKSVCLQCGRPRLDPWVRKMLEKEMAIHSSTVAWKIPWTEESGRLQSMGSQRVGHDWATSLMHILIMLQSLFPKLIFCC